MSTPVADIAEDDGENGSISCPRAAGRCRPGRFAGRRIDAKTVEALDQGLLALPVGDQVGDGNLLQPVRLGEGRDLGPAHHAAIVIDEFAG